MLSVAYVQEQASRAAGMVAAFCERLGIFTLELLVSQFQGRVLHGIKQDIIELTNLKGVKGVTARLLYTAGIQTVEDVHEATEEEVHAALVQGKRPDEQKGEWRAAKIIKKSAAQLMTVRPSCSAQLAMYLEFVFS
jgi:replicative superfamily II helicase